MPYDEEGKKKKKGKFSFLRSLVSGKPKTTGNQVQFKGRAGSYLEGKGSKKKKLDEAFKY
jgi:hypothetical protein